jgi:hypothetical protein
MIDYVEIGKRYEQALAMHDYELAWKMADCLQAVCPEDYGNHFYNEVESKKLEFTETSKKFWDKLKNKLQQGS